MSDENINPITFVQGRTCFNCHFEKVLKKKLSDKPCITCMVPGKYKNWQEIKSLQSGGKNEKKDRYINRFDKAL